MKNKLKLLIASILVVVLAFSFVGCSATIYGTWTATEVYYGDTKYDAEEKGLAWSIEFKQDGTYTINGRNPGTWEQKDNKYICTDKYYGTKLTFELEDDKLSVEQSGMTLVFIKNE